ncbi:MAG TPA: phosphate ABC transporter permease subunit PstC [Prolixibacteraceae bacterium]|jgi:phosphate transport system permease protein|nr:phosphate ABC transporter permease subunit PstC [Prolixibacteraceae bacterium]
MTKDQKKKKKSEPTTATLIDITQKKFRWSDYIAEKVIKGVAFLSITIIVLIFIFVFRESLPIFASQKASIQAKAIDSTAEVQETYGEVTDQPAVEETQETYGEVKDTASQSSTDKESYNVSAGSGFDDNQSALKTILTKDWVPVSEKPRYGILSLIIGTFKITIISLLFAAPLAILAALYTASFASKRMKEIIKPTIELLAGFPSVVIGFFALMVLATFLQNVFHYDTRLNSFVGGIAMGIAAIPIIFTITEDALTAVPKSFYEASLALGASKWQTAFFVILPAATPGIFAAVLLGIGRVFGETMIALMATGNAAQMGLNPFESVRTLAATIGAEMAEVVFGDTHYNVLFLIGSLLFIFTFVINAIAEFYVKGKLMKKIQGK